MQDLIAEITASLNVFLSGSKSKIKEVPDGQVMVNFITPVKNFRFDDKIDSLSKSYPRSFYFEKPSENISFLALDEVFTISENGDGRFAATEKKLKGWRDKLISNQTQFSEFELPLFVGGMKFTVEHSDENWKDFNDSTWFLPEIVFYRNNDKQFLIFNSVVSAASSEDKTIKKLRAKLEVIFKCTGDSSKQVSLKSINGNTPKEKKKWKNIVKESIDKIQDAILEKVVLSRQIEIILSDEPSINDLLKKLKDSNNHCFLFAYRNGKSIFFGASPERLLKVDHELLLSEALAGSTRRGDSEKEDNELETLLLNSKKNLYEHKLVVEHIVTSLNSYSESEPVVEKLSVRKLSNIQHLHTKVSCPNKSGSNIFRLVKELFPTPAVCGVPKDAALNLIEDLEDEQRGLYSGIVGWFNFSNSAELVVGIRSALSIGNKIIAYAGAGIVADSKPDEEYSETEIKLNSILSVFSQNAKN